MKKLRIAAITLMTFFASAFAVFADIADSPQDAPHNVLLPILLIAIAVIAIVLIIRAKKRRKQ